MPTKQEIRAAFALYDTNGDGQLSPDELKAIMCKAVPGGTARTEEEVDALVKQFDADGDGMLSMEEIAGAWAVMAIEETVKAATEAPETEGEKAAAEILAEPATEENAAEAPAVAAAGLDMVMMGELKDFDDWFAGFKAHATSTTFPMNGESYTASVTRGSVCDESKTDVLRDIKDPNMFLATMYGLDMPKMGAMMEEPDFKKMLEKAIIKQDPPCLIVDAPAPGTPPPAEKLDLFFSYVVEDPEKWIEGYLAHGTSKTGTWGVEAKYTRAEFCDESRSRVFRSMYDPKRVGGLCYATDMAKMGEFMADPSFATISEVMKFDMASMVMKVITPMPAPPAA